MVSLLPQVHAVAVGMLTVALLLLRLPCRQRRRRRRASSIRIGMRRCVHAHTRKRTPLHAFIILASIVACVHAHRWHALHTCAPAYLFKPHTNLGPACMHVQDDGEDDDDANEQGAANEASAGEGTGECSAAEVVLEEGEQGERRARGGGWGAALPAGAKPVCVCVCV